MIELYLKDNEFENIGITHTRHVARAIVLEDDKILMLKVNRDDEFGNATYLETSGGGVDDGETPEQAVLREIDEELGVPGSPMAWAAITPTASPICTIRLVARLRP